MPYRRLPNTDEARIRSLRCAVKQEELNGIHDLPFSLKVLQEAKTFLLVFERAQAEYKLAFKEQVGASKTYKELVKIARLYLSHFVQVLNLSVIRKEVKAEYKSFYGLTPDDFSIPDMLSDSAVLEWGEKIIEGETMRLSKGGSPIYNPPIAKVKVHYDMFKELYVNQKFFRQSTNRALEALATLRVQADEIILDLWNQVEETFKELPSKERLEQCRKYGIIYYYRKGEKKDAFD